MDVDRRARGMLTECVSTGQSARCLDELDTAAPLRAALRSLARAEGVRVRTALVDDVVVIARTDATLWRDDAATMRRKLTPPPGPTDVEPDHSDFERDRECPPTS